MRDRCWLEMRFPRKDLPRFNEILKDKLWEGVFWDEENGDEREVFAVVHEANYGWYDEIRALARAGLTFAASHGAGGEYGPCVYACYKGKLVGCSADWDGNPVVPVTRGCLHKVAYENCLKYWKLMEKIETEIQQGERSEHEDVHSQIYQDTDQLQSSGEYAGRS